MLVKKYDYSIKSTSLLVEFACFPCPCFKNPSLPDHWVQHTGNPFSCMGRVFFLEKWAHQSWRRTLVMGSCPPYGRSLDRCRCPRALIHEPVLAPSQRLKNSEHVNGSLSIMMCFF